MVKNLDRNLLALSLVHLYRNYLFHSFRQIELMDIHLQLFHFDLSEIKDIVNKEPEQL